MEPLEDVRYAVEDGVAVITIDRPERMNAFRARTVDELVACFESAWVDQAVGAIVLTGAGERAFCAGGDQKQRAETGDYGPSASGRMQLDRLHRLIRDVPKPVIAAVNGDAVGGGHVLQVLCDLSVASATARFGQAGPRVGSFDAGFGTGYLARIVGEKRARELWFLCELIDAQTAKEWGLVNRVVEPAEVLSTALEMGRRAASLSPTAIAFLKHAFNTDTEHLAGTQRLADEGLALFVTTDEAKEGATAFGEKRPPRFARFRRKA
ncbi:MAG: enoyl-CoA hydratase-related protein [Actinomycetota bacterium]